MPNRQYRVLLVEDDDTNLETIKTLLAQSGLRGQLTYAASYFDAVEEISKADYDICLLSSTLSDGMGLDLLREAADLNFKAPFVLLTGSEEIDLDGEASKLGIADYIPRKQLTAPLLSRVIRFTVERSEMVEALRELAVRDELTGLYNRRELRRVLSEEVSRTLRYHNPLSLLIIEIDNFTETNSRYGPQVGDMVIQSVAQLLRDGVRTTDRPARYSNESLAVALPETGKAGAILVADRLRKAVAARKITVASPDRRPVEITVSVSIGVASLPEDADTEDGLVMAASVAVHDSRQRTSQAGREPGSPKRGESLIRPAW
jgi:diguanylate cyclase (GGDEF)-like protein